MDECPADAIYQGRRQAFINPAECIGCGNCALVCPVGAIKPLSSLPETWKPYERRARSIFETLGATTGGTTFEGTLPEPDDDLPLAG
nr:4Fe-4S binding protein [Flexivirga aerilata]